MSRERVKELEGLVVSAEQVVQNLQTVAETLENNDVTSLALRFAWAAEERTVEREFKLLPTCVNCHLSSPSRCGEEREEGRLQRGGDSEIVRERERRERKKRTEEKERDLQGVA